MRKVVSKPSKDKTSGEEIAEYLRKNAKKGYTLESLKWALVRQGHARAEVEKVIKKVEAEMARESSAPQVKPQVTLEPAAVQPVEEKKSFWKRMFS